MNEYIKTFLQDTIRNGEMAKTLQEQRLFIAEVVERAKEHLARIETTEAMLHDHRSLWKAHLKSEPDEPEDAR